MNQLISRLSPARFYKLGMICSLVIFISIPFLPINSLANKQTALQTQIYSNFLPLIRSLDSFSQVPAIWVHDEMPATHEIALFQHTFTASEALNNLELQIFADTRYEIWLDGNWVGRGPARFTSNWHEYDRYQIDTLQPGLHTIGVLVQWAPNTRRSESVSPRLQLRLIHPDQNTFATIAVTGPHWLSQLSSAWRQDAADIAPINLIGPSELLDLRLLPQNWYLAEATSSGWRPAAIIEINATVFQAIPQSPQFVLEEEEGSRLQVPHNTSAIEVQDQSAIHYQPRSIPMLAEIPINISVVDAGELYPGFLTGELTPAHNAPYTIDFQASQAAAFTVELLSSEPPSSQIIQVDQRDAVWQAAGADRPDVYQSIIWTEAGSHQLLVNEIPEGGLTFGVSSQNFTFTSFPFEQGLHAGRRTLLAKPVTNLDLVSISTSDLGLEVQFNALPGYLILDLGRTVHGRVKAEVSGPAGTVLDIGWDERLFQNQRPLPYPGSSFPGWNQVDSWILDGISRQITTLDARAGRYVLIEVWGNAPLQLSHLKVFEERIPTTQIGSFNSSDPALNKIWQVGVDSLLPNLTDAYTDTPWRERGQWWGDAYIEDHVLQVSLNETDLMRRGLILMGQAMELDPAPGMAPHNDGMHLLDYSMLWVLSLAEYVQRSGDAELASQLYPTLIRFMSYCSSLESPLTQLIDLPKLHWSQTAYIDPRCFHCRYGQSTAINSLYYSTLLHAAQIASLQADHVSASAWQEKAQTVKTSVNQSLYLPEQGRYATTLYDGQLIAPGPHAQAWALAYDLPTEENIPSVTAALLELLSPTRASPTWKFLVCFGCWKV